MSEMSERRRSHTTILFASLVLLALAAPRPALGLANQPITGLEPPDTVLDPGDVIGPEVPPPPCQPSTGVSGLPTIGGTPLVGVTVTIEAEHLKLFNADPYCDTYYELLVPGEWSWELVQKPAASTTTLEGTDSLAPTMLIDAAGVYETRLTLCPVGCTFGSTLYVPPTVKTIRFETRDFIRPERHPIAPPSVTRPATCDLDTGTCRESSMPCESNLDCTAYGQPLFAEDLVKVKCQFGGGVLDPQWVTVKEFDGPETYSGYYNGVVYPVEGVIRRARISSVDSDGNHHSQDANWNVMPDGVYAHLKSGGGLTMHNEWETDTLDESFQPSRGDRVSMWGHLIHDCGHGGFKTEIHPPVGMAVHRKRAVRIPPDWTSPLLSDGAGNPSSVGNDVYVPGIVTDVWFNRDAGEMIEGGRTSLHQPATFQPQDCDLGVQANCFLFRGETGLVVEGEPIDDLSPLDAVFRFRVHLPRSPQATLETAGLSEVRETPLYYEVFPGNFPVDRIDVDVISESFDTAAPDVTYLQVDIDLTGNVGPDRPWFRMAAAWVYPDPENWDLRRRRVVIDKLHVTNEADGVLRGDGDWKLWAQVNNSSLDAPILTSGLPRQEWSKIISRDVDDGCDFYFGVGCGEDVTFSGRPWSTGNPSADRSLGPDPLVYPDQPVRVHLSGYEKDEFGGDSLGVIENLHYRPAIVEQKNACQEADLGVPGNLVDGHLPVSNGCARYSAFYEVRDLGSVGRAALTSAALDLRDDYRLRATECEDDVGPCIDDLVIDDGDLPDPTPPGVVHPLEELVLSGDEVESIYETDLYEKREVEEYVFNSLDLTALSARLETALEQSPEKVHAFLSELREQVDDGLVELGEEVLVDLQLLELAIPADLFETYFGDLRLPGPLGGTPTRWMRGAGTIGTGSGTTHVRLQLWCDPLRGPNRLDIKWFDDPYDQRRFTLELPIEVACEDPSQPMNTHSGRGLGRVNGETGYLAEWTFIDRGEGDHYRDEVGVRLVAPDGTVIHEMRGILSGQVHGYEAE